jgi:hypothetical protein
MEIKTIELTEIKAAENMVLTNGEAFSSVGGSVYLGVNDNPDNWHEITDTEYEEILKKQEEELKGETI